MVPLLERTAKSIREELPGLEVTFDVPRWRNYPSESEEVFKNDSAIVRYGMRAAEDNGVKVWEYDVVFVFSPRYQGRYFGRSHVRYKSRDGHAGRGALILTKPFRLIHGGMMDALGDKDPPPGFSPDKPIELVERLKGPLRGLLERARGGLEATLEAPGIREAILAPTIAHELGHFFAPGDLDIRDGYETEWMRHATGPDDNPENHGIECCMYKGRTPSFYVRKVLAIRGRLVIFCDECRRQLGCAAPATKTSPKPPAPAPDAEREPAPGPSPDGPF